MLAFGMSKRVVRWQAVWRQAVWWRSGQGRGVARCAFDTDMLSTIMELALHLIGSTRVWCREVALATSQQVFPSTG